MLSEFWHFWVTWSFKLTGSQAVAWLNGCIFWEPTHVNITRDNIVNYRNIQTALIKITAGHNSSSAQHRTQTQFLLNQTTPSHLSGLAATICLQPSSRRISTPVYLQPASTAESWITGPRPQSVSSICLQESLHKHLFGFIDHFLNSLFSPPPPLFATFIASSTLAQNSEILSCYSCWGLSSLPHSWRFLQENTQ